jgi:hypothetical protein
MMGVKPLKDLEKERTAESSKAPEAPDINKLIEDLNKMAEETKKQAEQLVKDIEESRKKLLESLGIK